MTDEELLGRAVSAYWRWKRSCGYDDCQIQQPSSSLSYRDGRTIVLRNLNGELGRYQITGRAGGERLRRVD